MRVCVCVCVFVCVNATTLRAGTPSAFVRVFSLSLQFFQNVCHTWE